MIAISTAFKTAQLAIELDGKQKLMEMDADCKVSENVLATLDTMLEELGVKIQDNHTYAVVVGPGSFTGLRIGIALVKGLCAAEENNKVIPLSSLALLAYSYIKQNKPKEDFYVVLNALSGLYFICKFDKLGKALSEEKLITAQQLEGLTEQKVGLKQEKLPFVGVEITPIDLLEFAKKQEKIENFVDFHTLAPVYLRRSQAEVALDEKNVKKV